MTAAGLLFAVAFFAVVLFAGFGVYRVYLRHVPAVALLAESLEPCEAEVAAHRGAMLQNLAGPSLNLVVARGAISEFSPHNGRSVAWHLRYGLFSYLLPYSLSAAQLTALYAHYLPLQGGAGLCFGARAYFSKSAEALTDHELVELVVIAREPRRFSSTEGRVQARLDATVLLAGGK